MFSHSLRRKIFGHIISGETAFQNKMFSKDICIDFYLVISSTNESLANVSLIRTFMQWTEHYNQTLPISAFFPHLDHDDGIVER